ncbi:MAG TPA: formyltransferase family protein, partial [Nitrolancea sp.]|nr:formyltransferase family protein [Nitrolancea sp.]
RYRPSIRIDDTPDSLERIAGERGVPLYDVRRPLGAELRSILEHLEPALLVAACFPWLLPPSISEVVALGGVNLHPSPLPRFRGPDPLFWAYRCAQGDWGVAVHQIAESYDSGPILAQQSFSIADAMPGDELERQAASLGADLLLTVLERASWGTLHGTTQDEASATYQSWPSADELLIDRDWSVQRVLNFVIGIRPLGYEPAIDTSRGLRLVRTARSIDRSAENTEVWVNETTVCLRFADGVVEFTVA